MTIGQAKRIMVRHGLQWGNAYDLAVHAGDTVGVVRMAAIRLLRFVNTGR